MIDFERVTREVLRALRAHRSQVQLARRLGYRSNPVAEWEGGRRAPRATDLLAIGRAVGVDAARALWLLDPAPPTDADDGEVVAGAMRRMAGDQRCSQLARQLGRSRSAVSRWLSGATQPRLPELLAYVHAATGRLPDLIVRLVDIAEVPSLRDAHARATSARRLLFDQPWTLAVMACAQTLEDAGLPTSEAVIAERLRISPEIAAKALEGLVDAGVMARGFRFTGTSLTVDTDAVPGGPDQLKQHWMEVARSRHATRSEADQFGYAVFGVSHDDLEQIRDAYRAFYRTVRSIATASHPTETVALLNLQLVELSPAP